MLFQSSIVIVALTVTATASMVSKVRYHSFKQVDLKGKIPFVAILLVVLIFASISLDLPKVMFLIFFGHAISGSILTLWNLRKTRLLRLHN